MRRATAGGCAGLIAGGLICAQPTAAVQPVAVGARTETRAAAGSASLVVTVNGVPVDVESLLLGRQPDVVDATYTVCQADGGSSPTRLTGWSVATVLGAAGVGAESVRSITVPRISTPGEVLLRPPDYLVSATGYPSFPEGPALIVERTTGAQQQVVFDFFRPYRQPSCAADANGGDHVVTPVGEPLHVAIASGTALAVDASADLATPRPGQAVTFTGRVLDPPAGTLDFRWDFGDGTTGSGGQAVHAYGGPGSYAVTLTVDQGPAAGGTAAPVLVTVGRVAQGPPTPGAGAVATPRGGSTAGPARQPAGSRGRRDPSPPRPSAPAGRSAGPAPTSDPAPAAAGSATATPAPDRTAGPRPGQATGSLQAPAPTALPTATGAAPAPSTQDSVIGQPIAVPPAGTAANHETPDLAALAFDQTRPGARAGAANSAPAAFAALAVLLACLGGGAVGEFLSSRRRSRR